MAEHEHHHEHDENCAHDHDHDHDAHDRPDVFDQIRQYGDPVLRTPTLEITRFDRDLRDEAERMAAIMDAAHGVGLAAPQIGMLSRLAVMRIDGDDSDRVTVLCNPRIVWRSDEEEDGVEGCLSIGEASIAVNVMRALAVRVEAQDLAGNALEFEREGYAARVVQHEVDHLDGVLMLDRTTPEDRRDALRALRRR
jgi:peptide deformylase